MAAIFLTSKDNSSHSNRCETFKFGTSFWEAGIRQQIYNSSTFLTKILSVKRFFINDHGNPIAAIIVNLNFFSYNQLAESTVSITTDNCLFLYPCFSIQLFIAYWKWINCNRSCWCAWWILISTSGTTDASNSSIVSILLKKHRYVKRAWAILNASVYP